MANIALFPGSYKPPHIGHYTAAKQAAQIAGKVKVFVGSGEREGITQGMSVQLWELYTQNDPNIEIIQSLSSPVTDVYDYVELEAKDGDIIYFIKGDKDADDPRFKNIEKYAEKVKKKIKKRPIDVPDIKSRTGKEMSGRLMRAYIKSEDKRSFIDGLPKGTNGEQAWNIVTGNTDYSTPKGGTISTQLTEVFSDNQATINDQLISLEIMVTPEDQMRGMMGRNELDGGMLFPYRIAGEKSFHMKGCLIPLDIVFITQGEITNIDPNCPPCYGEQCPQYTGLADNVLELPGNYCQENNINIGDYIKFPQDEPYSDTTAGRDHAKSSEWKAGMPDGPKKDIPRTKNQIHNRQSNPHAHMSEQIQPTEGKILHVYDFDDTVASIETQIPIELPNGELISVSSTTFPETSVDLDNEWGSGAWKPNFSEFDKQIENAILNTGVVNKLKNSLSQPTIKTTILTARTIGHPVTRFLKDIGLETYVVPLGLVKQGARVTGQDKAKWIENHINKGYNTIYFIDDSAENRTAVEALKNKYLDINLTVEDPASILETKYGAHDSISQHKDKIQLDYGHQQYRDLQLMISQQKDEEVNNWLKTKGYMNETRLFSKNWWKKQLTETLLTEGGAAGHMNHPFDDRDLTFAEMKELVRLSLQGKLNIEADVQEKTDGQNLAVTYKNGRIGAARNKATIREPMSIDAVAAKFEGRGDIKDAFVNSMRDLENALKELPEEILSNIFKEGTNFLNMEIIYPATKNVITYGSKAYLQFHGIDEFNLDSATKIQSYGVPEELKQLTQNINAKTQETFELIPPKILTTKEVRDFDRKEPNYINQINQLQQEFNLQDSDEVVIYHQKWWETKINKEYPEASEEEKEALVRRWAYFDKSFRLTKIQDEDTKIKAIDFDKTNFKQQNKENVYQFEKIFLELGVDVLSNIENFLAVNPEESVKELKNNIAAVIKQIQASTDLEVLNKLKYQLKRIQDIGGFEKLVPSEGIVFIYKGKTYKLTGLFAPVNQLLGLTKYV